MASKNTPAAEETAEVIAEDEVAKEVAKPEKPKELEEDAPEDERARLDAGAVTINAQDTTLNVVSALGGSALMALSDGALQYFIAGAKASVGLKGGRYMFEVAVVESRSPEDVSGGHAAAVKPRQLVRVGFATAEASLLLDDAESIYFDSEGMFAEGHGSKKRISQKIGQGCVVAALLNLDPKSPNKDTVSLFVDGVRVCAPQPLPDTLKGKALFPAVAYRNVTLRVGFGPEPLRPLPFVCRTVQDAAKADCVVTKALPPKDGKYEVLLPVGVPNEGTFDWLDHFLSTNKGYTEVSDRSIVQWAAKSGLRPIAGKPISDRAFVEELGVRKVLDYVLPMSDRSLVVMDVRAALLAEERKDFLARFPPAEFRTIAYVAMGEPDAAFKQHVHEALLKVKYEKETKKKRLDVERKKAEELRKKKALEAKRAREAKAGKKDVENSEEKAAEEEKVAEEDENKEDENKETAEREAEVAIVLTEEEKKQWFRKSANQDLTPKELAASITKFSIPEESEGFTDVKFVWQEEIKCKEYLEQWVTEKKLTQRVEGIQPGSWFKQQMSEWNKVLSEWNKKQTAYKEAKKQKDAAKKKSEAEQAQKEKGDEKGEDEDGTQNEEKDEDVPMKIDAEDIEVFDVENVNDIGNGEPLYANFSFEDWALLALRVELHLLVHGFRRDLDDPERTTFHESHVGYYYNKYFKKNFSVKDFGCADMAGLVTLLEDTVEYGEHKLLQSLLWDDTPLDNFAKLAEEHRRDRLRRLDLGDETAKLKFTATPPPPQEQRFTPIAPTSRAPTSIPRALYKPTAPAYPQAPPGYPMMPPRYGEAPTTAGLKRIFTPSIYGDASKRPTAIPGTSAYTAPPPSSVYYGSAAYGAYGSSTFGGAPYGGAPGAAYGTGKR